MFGNNLLQPFELAVDPPYQYSDIAVEIGSTVYKVTVTSSLNAQSSRYKADVPVQFEKSHNESNRFL